MKKLAYVLMTITTVVALTYLERLAYCADSAPLTKVNRLELQKAILTKAQSYLYVRELHPRNGNRSPEIDAWLKYLGLPPGLSYCLTYGVYCTDTVYEQYGLRRPLPKIGHCGTMLKLARKDKYAYTVYTPRQIERGIAKITPTDIIIWSHNKTLQMDKSYTWPGHAELAKQQTGLATVDTYGANTVGVDDAKAQREQGAKGPVGGVWLKHRRLGSASSFNPEGIIHIN